MAIKRMFSKKVIETDRFTEMTPQAQLLYIHFGLNADDDGFVSNYKTIVRSYGNKDNLQELLENNYIIPFQDGVIVISHWNINNSIRSDRYTKTIYQNDYKMLDLQEDIYTLKDGIPNGIHSGIHSGIPSGSQEDIPSGMRSIVELSLVENSLVESSVVDDGIPSGSQNETQTELISYGEFDNIHLTKIEYRELCKTYSKILTDKTINKMSNHIKKKNGSGYGDKTADKIREWLTKDYSEHDIKSALENENRLNKLEQYYLNGGE